MLPGGKNEFLCSSCLAWDFLFGTPDTKDAPYCKLESKRKVNLTLASVYVQNCSPFGFNSSKNPQCAVLNQQRWTTCGASGISEGLIVGRHTGYRSRRAARRRQRRVAVLAAPRVPEAVCFALLESCSARLRFRNFQMLPMSSTPALLVPLYFLLLFEQHSVSEAPGTCRPFRASRRQTTSRKSPGRSAPGSSGADLHRFQYQEFGKHMNFRQKMPALNKGQIKLVVQWIEVYSVPVWSQLLTEKGGV